MWTATEMSIPESFVVSLMGLCVVMMTLICLALVVFIFSKIMERGNAAGSKKVKSAAVSAAGGTAAAAPEVSQDVCAMILAVICEELEAAPEEINVKSIRRIS